MRGKYLQQQALFSYLSPTDRVPQDHPLRPIRRMVNQTLAELTGEFQSRYAREGRLPSYRKSCGAPWCCKSFTPSAAPAC